jgi:hypothetical protein
MTATLTSGGQPDSVKRRQLTYGKRIEKRVDYQFPIEVLLCHKCNLTSPQHGHRGSLLMIARAMSTRSVEIESGTWRCTRPAAARDVTFG